MRAGVVDLRWWEGWEKFVEDFGGFFVGGRFVLLGFILANGAVEIGGGQSAVEAFVFWWIEWFLVPELLPGGDEGLVLVFGGGLGGVCWVWEVDGDGVFVELGVDGGADDVLAGDHVGVVGEVPEDGFDGGDSGEVDEFLAGLVDGVHLVVSSWETFWVICLTRQSWQMGWRMVAPGFLQVVQVVVRIKMFVRRRVRTSSGDSVIQT